MIENIDFIRDWYFDINKTIFLGYRVCLKDGKDSLYYVLNYCCGKNLELAYKLIKFIKGLTDAEIDCLPEQSDIKPLYNDPKFLQKLQKLGFQI